ncbi:GDSL-type esterase/lipase family protein [Pantoea sp. PNT03]|uniref:tail fiber/spike domain-containing protein n=1 Tax=Pantoea sp. PNT03 TaxID=2769258 RepID=UPI001786BF56|nr:GDSL-type esterase/lipase family protein [Pantoea sp. PNT03]MBD9658125.1 hypothetical protein [Pantoea sp. PNT03]
MATQPTNNAVPSESPRDLKFNAGKIDEFVTSLTQKYQDRFGNNHYTIEGLRWLAQQAISQYGYITVDSFLAGANITLPNQVLRDSSTGEYYRWDGVLPKAVPANSTPQSAGGIGKGAWLSVGDASLRSNLNSSMSGMGDALIAVKQELAGSIIRNQHEKNAEIISVKDFGAKLDGIADDTSSFQAAAATGKPIYVPHTITAIKLSTYVDGFFYAYRKIVFTGGGYAKITVLEKQNLVGQFNNIISKLDRLGNVNITCFGDSTTEGHGSTGWTVRPSGSQSGYKPPNSFPAKLQTILRDMYSSTSITVNNAGYGGQSIIDDWAYNNYKSAVTDLFGVPDAVIVTFGLNDIQKSYFTYTLFKQKLFELVWLILKDGTLPIIQSSNPVALTNPSNINNKNLASDVWTAQKEVADFFGIPFIDQQEEQKKWLTRNNDQLGDWLNLQPDMIHYGDIGYCFMASVTARALAPFVVTVNGHTKIPAWSGKVVSRTGNALPLFTGSNNAVGGNLLWQTGDANSGDKLTEIWVWNDEPMSTLRYMSVGNDGNTSTAIANHPSVNLTAISYNYAALIDAKVAGAGMPTGADKNPSECAQLMGQMPYGLNRIYYRINAAVDADGYYMGYFSVTPGAQFSILKKSQFVVPGSIANMTVLDVPFDPFNDTRVGFGVDGNVTNITLSGTWPIETGVILCESNAFYYNTSPIATSNGSKADGYKAGILLFRNTANKLSIWDIYWKNRTGEVYLGSSSITAGAVFTADGYSAVVGLYKNASGFNIDVKLNGPDTTLLRTVPFGTFVGSSGGHCGSIVNGTGRAAAVMLSHTIGFI